MTIPTNSTIALTNLPAALAAYTGHRGKAPGYRKLYTLILDGAIPADRINGRLYVSVDLLPQLAEHFALKSARKNFIAA